MAVNKFWKIDIIYHDEGDRKEVLEGHTSGVPHAAAYLDMLKEHQFKNRNVTITVEDVGIDGVDISKHPFAPVPNKGLYNAAGKQVTESHEVVPEGETIDSITEKLREELERSHAARNNDVRRATARLNPDSPTRSQASAKVATSAGTSVEATKPAEAVVTDVAEAKV